jgi:diguanylate cyclase (GGDEF)-like protein
MRGRTEGRRATRSRPALVTRWSRGTLIAIALAGSVLLAIPIGDGGAADRLVLLYLPLLLVLGLTARRPPVLVIAPAAAISFAVGFGASGDLTPVVAIHFALVLAVGTASLVALSDSSIGSSTAADRSIPLDLAALIDGTRALERADTIDAARATGERALRELLGADAVVIHIGRHHAGDGDPPDVHGAVAHGFIRPWSPAWRAIEAQLPSTITSGARAALVVPLGDPAGGTGTAIVLWHRELDAPNAEVVQAVELLTADAAEAVERARARQQLDAAPHTDPLTGLLSRRLVRARLAELRPGDVVVVLDLDHLASYNVRKGTGAGDRTVRALAACLADSCRRDDWCGRLDDEEFIAVFRGAGASASAAVARVRDRWADLGSELTFSAGVAVHQRGHGPADTLAHAQGALDLAKDRGRDRVELFPGDAVTDPY